MCAYPGAVSRDRQNRIKLTKIARSTTPVDEASLRKAIDELNAMQYIYNLKGAFFDTLRSKVPFPDRVQYIQMLAGLEHLDIYTKLSELKRCKECWEGSSAALADAYKGLGVPLLRLHVEDLVSHDQLSGYDLKQIADLAEVSIATLHWSLSSSSPRPMPLCPTRFGLPWHALCVRKLMTEKVRRPSNACSAVMPRSSPPMSLMAHGRKDFIRLAMRRQSPRDWSGECWVLLTLLTGGALPIA
jgi:hypothetical protein